MSLILTVRRLRNVSHVFIRFGLSDLVGKPAIRRLLKAITLLFFWHRNKAYAQLSQAERFTKALEALGPVFIKFGQMLSTRSDLIPENYALALSRLQDKVPPFSSEVAKKIIEDSIGQPVSVVFSHFVETPMASASIAQVHEARLLDGTEVIVKVIRPNLETTIKKDIVLMRFVANFVERFIPGGKRLNAVQVVNDYEHTIFDELDLLKEAANTSQLRRNFEGSKEIYFPQVFWTLCRRNVMVAERVYGTPVNQVDYLKQQGTNLKLLAERGVQIFFTQVFNDNFFHADMHPGNILVDITDPENPGYIGLDCAIVGSLSRQDQRYLAENFIAFFDRDYHRVAELHVQSGWVPPGTSVIEFESAIRTVCEPIFEKPLKDISYATLLVRLFQTAQRFEMEIQPQLILLEKTLIYVEGLGRQLYPELDLWRTAKPFMKNWMTEQVGPDALVKQLARQWPDFVFSLPDIAHRLTHPTPAYALPTGSHTTDNPSRSKHSWPLVVGGCILGFGLSTVPQALWVTTFPLILVGVGLLVWRK